MTKGKEIDPASVLPRRDVLSDSEAFASEMADVVPLGVDRRGRVGYASPIVGPAAAIASDHGGPGEDDAFTNAITDGFAAHGVDRREIRKLKRGDYPPGERHDLHGMTSVNACASVQRFIDSSRRARQRCVCIVHGRGMHSSGTAILKIRVRQYLRSHRAVLAYADAPWSDGGSGAVYVLLRRSP
ncbi:MAG: Smr/MutS family protein [Acidobacteriota bacterium]